MSTWSEMFWKIRGAFFSTTLFLLDDFFYG